MSIKIFKLTYFDIKCGTFSFWIQVQELEIQKANHPWTMSHNELNVCDKSGHEIEKLVNDVT